MMGWSATRMSHTHSAWGLQAMSLDNANLTPGSMLSRDPFSEAGVTCALVVGGGGVATTSKKIKRHPKKSKFYFL